MRSTSLAAAPKNPIALQTAGIPEALAETFRHLESLRGRPERWNGYDVAASNPQAIDHALTWIKEYYQQVLQNGGLWITPHVTTDEEGNVVFEWTHGAKEVSVYVAPDSVEYVRQSGSGPNAAMEEGVAEAEADRLALWQWLAG